MKLLNIRIIFTGLILIIQTLLLQSCSTDVGGNEDRVPPVVTIDAITDGDDSDGEIIGQATILWTTDEPNPSTVDILLSSDSGENYDTTIVLDTPDTGTYVWDTNTAPDCRACRLRIITRDVVGNVSEPGDSSEDFIINNVPQVLGVAFYTDMNNDGPGNGDSIRVPFDKDLELLTSIASDIFFFPVLGDGIGPFATVEKSIKQNELVITFNDLVGSRFHLHVRDRFDQEKLNRTAPSGMNLRDNLAQGILFAKDTGRTAAPAETGIDIAPTFNDSGQPLNSDLTSVSATQSVVLGDVDRDGDLDLITGNVGLVKSNRVWRNNDGVFTFSPVPDELGNSGTYSVALGDVDSDGDLDLVAGNDGENRVWRNDDGVFADSGQALGNSSTKSVALDDLDGDGDLDLIAGNGGNDNNANRVWLNDNGMFTDSGQALGDSNTSSVALDDIDGDGDLDLVSGNFSLNFEEPEPNHVWRNDGSGRFPDSDPLDDLKTISVVLGDVNGDGDPDLVAGNSSGPDSIWRNDEGVFNRVQQLGDSSTNSVVLVDVDGDGDLDIITGNSPREPNRVWLNNINNEPGEQGVFTDSGQALGNSDTTSVTLGDVDGDSDLDLVAGNINDQNRIWLSSNRSPQTALFVGSLQALGNNTTSSVTLGDIDGDGDLDLVAGNGGVDDANRVWRNDDGEYIEIQQLGDSRTRSVALGDIDGDGDLDLVAANGGIENNVNRVWRNDGGVFGNVPDLAGENNTQSVALGDVDGDDDLDLVFGNFNDLIQVWRNDGGVFDVILDEVNDSNAQTVALGDVDGDGYLDIVAGKFDAITVWRNDGSGKFPDSNSLDDTNTISVALGDIDGDDDIDLVAGNSSGPNSVWRNNDGVFNRVQQLGNSSTNSVVLGDVDADGDLDLISGNTDGEPDRVWLNNVYNTPEQKGVFTEAGSGLGDSDTTSVAIGDVDGDGDLDFVAGNDGENRVWLNDY